MDIVEQEFTAADLLRHLANAIEGREAAREALEGARRALVEADADVNDWKARLASNHPELFTLTGPLPPLIKVGPDGPIGIMPEFGSGKTGGNLADVAVVQVAEDPPPEPMAEPVPAAPVKDPPIEPSAEPALVEAAAPVDDGPFGVEPDPLAKVEALDDETQQLPEQPFVEPVVPGRQPLGIVAAMGFLHGQGDVILEKRGPNAERRFKVNGGSALFSEDEILDRAERIRDRQERDRERRVRK